MNFQFSGGSQGSFNLHVHGHHHSHGEPVYPNYQTFPIDPSVLDANPLQFGENPCQFCGHRIHHIDGKCPAAIQNTHQTCFCASRCGGVPHCGSVCGKEFVETKTVHRHGKSHQERTTYVCQCNVCVCSRCRPVIDCGCGNCGCHDCGKKKDNRKMIGAIVLGVGIILALIAIGLIGRAVYLNSKFQSVGALGFFLPAIMLFAGCVSGCIGGVVLRRGIKPPSKWDTWRY
eukprot:TRINITY_DN8437_c0_g1_i1.p1 TRINITY_DN8437_c0_g1~~TRINITY_DN8437_c0_g1_i1.p1  ORF type:complete len:230 (-),score=8.73 TRINITY_DN8437_c0_g1_i1:8-697(-)